MSNVYDKLGVSTKSRAPRHEHAEGRSRGSRSRGVTPGAPAATAGAQPWPGADWMKYSALAIADEPLRYVGMPGSHDSGTYGITTGSALSPDATTAIKVIYESQVPESKQVVVGWAKAQPDDVRTQLEAGIRYLDLRIAPHNGGFWICHSLFSVDVDVILSDVKAFLTAHDKEMVILDFQHFYDMTKERHQQLASKIVTAFGSLLIPSPLATPATSIDVTMQELWRATQRVLVFYGNDASDGSGDQGSGSRYVLDHPNEYPFWDRGRYLDDRYDAPHDIAQLHANLERYIDERPVDKFFKLQCVLTPTDTQYATGCEGAHSLKQLGGVVDPPVTGWLAGWAYEDLNIAIVDWYTATPDYVATMANVNFDITVYPADVDGDGKDELVFYDHSVVTPSGALSIAKWIPGQDGQTPAELAQMAVAVDWLFPTHSVALSPICTLCPGDIDGDKRDEVLMYRLDGGGYLTLLDYDGAKIAQRWERSGYLDDAQTMRLAGPWSFFVAGLDGKDNGWVVAFDYTSATLAVFQATNTGLLTLWSATTTVGGGLPLGIPWSIFVGDIDGDSKDELVFYNPYGAGELAVLEWDTDQLVVASRESGTAAELSLTPAWSVCIANIGGDKVCMYRADDGGMLATLQWNGSAFEQYAVASGHLGALDLRLPWTVCPADIDGNGVDELCLYCQDRGGMLAIAEVESGAISLTSTTSQSFDGVPLTGPTTLSRVDLGAGQPGLALYQDDADDGSFSMIGGKITQPSLMWNTYNADSLAEVVFCQILAGRGGDSEVQVLGLSVADGVPCLSSWQSSNGTWFPSDMILDSGAGLVFTALDFGYGDKSQPQITGLATDQRAYLTAWQKTDGTWYTSNLRLNDTLRLGAIVSGNGDSNQLKIIGLGTDGHAYIVAWQNTKGTWFPSGYLLDGDASLKWLSLVTGRGSTNFLEVFGIAPDQRAYVVAAQDPGGNWIYSPPFLLNGDDRTYTSIVVGNGDHDDLQVIGLGTDQRAYLIAWQKAGGDWTSPGFFLQGDYRAYTSIVVGRGDKNELQVIGLGADQLAYLITWQDTGGTWHPSGRILDPNVKYAELRTVRGDKGELQVIGRGANNGLAYLVAWQDTNGAWYAGRLLPA